MQTAPAAEPGAPPTSMQLPGWGNRAWEFSPGSVVLPVTSRNHRYPRRRGLWRLNVSLVAIATVAAVAAAYLVLRCAVYLENARRSRVTLRFLAGSEETTNKVLEAPCRPVVEDKSASPTASATDGEEEDDGPLVEQDLLAQANRYAVELARLVERSEQLLLRVPIHFRAKCTGELLCLCLTELSALSSLLERKDRAGIHEKASSISKVLKRVMKSIQKSKISSARKRHIDYLQAHLRKITDVEYTATALSERARLLKIKRLLQLQDMALVQLNDGFAWLRTATDEAKSGAKPAPGAAAATEGVSLDAGGAAAPGKGAAAAGEGAAAAAEARFASVIMAIRLTVNERRDKVLIDPVLSRWLREVNLANRRYSMMSHQRLGDLLRSPLPPHHEVVEALKATPLGSGGVPWELGLLEEIDAPEEVEASLASEAPSGGDEAPPPKDPADAPPARGPLKAPRHGSQKRKGKKGSKPAAPPSASLTRPASVAAAAPTVQGMHTRVHAPSLPKTVPLPAASGVPSQTSAPAAGGYSQGSVTSVAPQRGAVYPGRRRAGKTKRAPSADPVSGVTSSGRSVDSPLSPGVLPIPAPSGFRGAVPGAAPAEGYGISLPGSDTQPPIGPSVPETSWASVVQHGFLHTSKMAPSDDFDRAPGAWRPRRGTPFISVSPPRARPTRHPPTTEAEEAWSLQITVGDDNEFQTPGLVPGSSASPSQEPVSQHIPSFPWGPPEPRSSETAGPQGPADYIYWAPGFQVWAPLERAVRVPTTELLLESEPVTAHGPLVEDVTLASRMTEQSSGGAVIPSYGPGAAARSAAGAPQGAATSVAAATASPSSVERGADSRSPSGIPSERSFDASSPREHEGGQAFPADEGRRRQTP